MLLRETVDLLKLRSGLTYVDATAGGGGHLQAIIDALSGAPLDSLSRTSHSVAAVIGIDRDGAVYQSLSRSFAGKASLFHGNFAEIKSILDHAGISTVTGGIIADLGLSSMQLDDPERGFSFLKEGPLDMRMDQNQALTAAEIVNRWTETELARIIYQYGEERYSRAIARNIVNCRPLNTTTDLAEVVIRTLRYKQGNIADKTRVRKKSKRLSGGNFRESHPATRTFQALRIAVNDELGNLKKFLEDSITLLAPGARLAVIAFHSLEDRLVKQIFRQKSLNCQCPPRQPICTCHRKSELLIITKKPIVAEKVEVSSNIRSRSAKLRVAEKLE